MREQAVVVQSHRTKWKKNPISGHEWPEITLIQRWHISGGQCPTEFNSEQAAQDHCDFINKVRNGGFDDRT